MTLDSAIHPRTAIKALMREDYISLGSFRSVGNIWGTSSGTAHRMITKGYWPASKRIQKTLKEKAKERGIIITGRKRVRVDLDPNTGKDELEAIRGMTAAERTGILLDFIKENK